MKIKSCFISDTHLNSPFSKAEVLSKFLKLYDCDNLYLVGDILDFYVKGFNIDKHQLDVIRKIATKAKRGVNVVYVLGNHDEILSHVLEYDVNIINIKFVHDYIYETGGKRILLTHGHIMDIPIVRHLYLFGDACYHLLLQINSSYNWIRGLFGMKYYSLSQKIKDSVKTAISFIEDFEHSLIEYTKSKNCDACITGHIHKAEMKRVEDVVYMNCGDWVESCTAVIETLDGEFQLIQYIDGEFKTIKNIVI
jgi:UDP-2,3-diacylglucosamine pyrophosphatase LpxH